MIDGAWFSMVYVWFMNVGINNREQGGSFGRKSGRGVGKLAEHSGKGGTT